MHTVDQLYESKTLKTGYSRRADEAIVAVYNGLNPDNGRSSSVSFEKTWQELVVVLLEELPNVSPYNLLFIDSSMISRGLHGECALLHRLIVEIIPDSSEQYGALGRAYQRIGKLDKAIVSYQKAVDLAIEVAERAGDIKSMAWIDVALQLERLADVEAEAGYLQDAVVHANRALRMSITGGDETAGLLKFMAQLFDRLEMSDLAEQFRDKAYEEENAK